MNKKIDWCKRQKTGIKLIEPNDNLSKEYFNNAEETLKILNQIKNINSLFIISINANYLNLKS